MEFVLYKFRFYIAAVVFFGNFASNLSWSLFASITPTASQYFNVSNFSINLLSLIFFIVYIIFGPIATWAFSRYGLGCCLLIGTWLNAIGSLVTFIGGYTNYKYIFAVCGQSIAAIGQPFVLGSMSFVSAHWFGEHERMNADTFMTLGAPIGAAVILGVAPLFVQSNPDLVRSACLFVFVISLLVAIGSSWVKDRPESPPSIAARHEPEDYLQGLFHLFKLPNYLFLSIISGLLVGAFNAFVTIVSDYITAFGYTEDQSGYLGVVTIVTGLLSALLMAPVLDRTQQYTLALRLCCLIVTIGSCLLLLTDNYAYLVIASALIGAGGFPAIPMTLELGVEASFPVSEGTSGGFLMWTGQVLSIILVLAANGFRNNGKLGHSAIIMLIICSALSIIVSFFFKNESRRHMFDVYKPQ